MNNKLVSVIIPTHKRPVLLSRSIKSVLNQTYRNIELVIVDDNLAESTFQYETNKLVMSYNDPRIKYINPDKHYNASYARNAGINVSKGDYITFLDDDDEFELSKIEEQVNFMNGKSDDWIGCYTLFHRYKDGKLFDKSTDHKSGSLYLDFFLNQLYICGGSNIFVRADIVRSIDGFDASFSRMQDLEFIIRISELGKIGCINKNLLRVYFHSQQINVSSDILEKHISHFFTVFKERISAFNDSTKKEIYRSKYLDLIKKLIREKKILKAIYVSRKFDINVLLLLRYFLYLIIRKVSKKCFGFKVDRNLSRKKEVLK